MPVGAGVQAEEARGQAPAGHSQIKGRESRWFALTLVRAGELLRIGGELAVGGKVLQLSFGGG